MTAKTTDTIALVLTSIANTSAIMLSINGAVGFLVPLIVCFISMVALRYTARQAYAESIYNARQLRERVEG